MKTIKVFFIFFVLPFLFGGCISKENKQELVNKEFAQGVEYFGPLVTLFNKAELNKTTSVFKEICNINNLTSVMKLQGYNCVFLSFERMKSYDSSLMFADSCINTIEQNNLQAYLPNFYLGFLLSKSSTLYNLHQSDKANELFYKAKKQIDMLDATEVKYMMIEKLGLVAYNQKNYNEASEGFKTALVLDDKMNSKNYYKKAEIVDNIGLCYFKLQQYEKALNFYNAAIDTLNRHADNLAPYIEGPIGNKVVYNHSKGVIVGNIANVYNALQQYDSAIKYSKLSILLNSEQEGERLDAQMVSSRLIDIYIKLTKWKDAEVLMQQVKKGLDSLPDASVRMNWYRQMATLLEQKNKTNEAFFYFKTYNQIKDSINKIELADAENNIVKDLQIKNQNADLSLLKKDNQLSQLYIWIAVGLIIIAIAITILIFTNYKKGKRKNLQLTQLNEEISAQQKLTEEALQQLSVSNREKDRILNVVAHDLRNPIGAIANFLDIVQVKYEHSEDEEKILKSSRNAAVHSLTLINELLEVNEMSSGKQGLKKSSFDINKLVDAAIEQLQFKANAKQQVLKVTKPDYIMTVNADAEKLQRVVTNLVDNAIKFSDVNKTIEVGLEHLDNIIQLTVKDAGIGIPNNIKEQLFTASITVKRKGTNNEKSNGLGLSICKQIVEAHEGKIWVESEESSGTTFFITIPLA